MICKKHFHKKDFKECPNCGRFTNKYNSSCPYCNHVFSSPSKIYKLCPSCRNQMRMGVELCPHCGHVFDNQSKNQTETYKTCPNCSNHILSTKKICPICGYEYIKKPMPKLNNSAIKKLTRNEELFAAIDRRGGLRYIERRKINGATINEIAKSFKTRRINISDYCKKHNTSWEDLAVKTNLNEVHVYNSLRAKVFSGFTFQKALDKVSKSSGISKTKIKSWCIDNNWKFLIEEEGTSLKNQCFDLFYELVVEKLNFDDEALKKVSQVYELPKSLIKQWYVEDNWERRMESQFLESKGNMSIRAFEEWNYGFDNYGNEDLGDKCGYYSDNY